MIRSDMQRTVPKYTFRHRGISALQRGARTLLFALAAFFEPLARLAVVLAFLLAAVAGLCLLAGTDNAPVRELIFAAAVCAGVPVVYYVVMRHLRP
jgi:hypothetical protein